MMWNWLKSLFSQEPQKPWREHNFSKWERIESNLPATVPDMQERRCRRCGYIQRASLQRHMFELPPECVELVPVIEPVERIQAVDPDSGRSLDTRTYNDPS